MSGKRRIESEESQSEEDGQNEDDEYTVEVITKARVKEDGSCDFLVKWYGYSSDDDSWEPEEHVDGCRRLISSFWKNIRKQKKNSPVPGPPGTEHTATDAWIEKQRKLVKLSMTNAQKKRAEDAGRSQKRKEESISAKHVPQKSIKVSVGADAPSKERQSIHEDLKSLLFSEMSDGSGSEGHSSTKPNPSKTKGRLGSLNSDSKNPSTPSPMPKSKLQPTLPPIQLPTSQKSKLAGLKIPKKSAKTGNAQSPAVKVAPADEMDIDSPGGLAQRTPTSVHSPSTFTGPPQRTHPRLVDVQSGPVFTATTAARPAPPTELATDMDVDNFMATVMPFSDSLAQRPENLASSQVTATPSLDSRANDIGATWKWSGELLLDTAGSAEKLCDISIANSTNIAELGFRLDIIMNSKPSLRFSKVYNRFEIKSILRALKKVDQVAKISYREEKDKCSFMMLHRYLKSGGLAMAAPVITDNGHVAQIVAFPAPPTPPNSSMHTMSTAHQLFSNLNIPNHYLGNDSLVVVLMPWSLIPSRYPELSIRSDELDLKRQEAQEQSLKDYRTAQKLSTPISGNVDRAIRVLAFPEWFLSFMKTRSYCVWDGLVEPTPRSRGQEPGSSLQKETKFLVTLMDNLKAKNVGHKADVRVIFVHVGALRTINKLEALADRRLRPEIQFITYGSHYSVKPMFWGFDQLYPLGGIITVTISALLENPVGISNIIELAATHRLWSCYILPSVLSIFIRLSCPGDDPVSTYAEEPWRFTRIIEFIEDGKLALMNSPPLSGRTEPGCDMNAQEQWMVKQYACLPKTTTELIEEAWTTYIANYAGKTEEEMRQEVEQEIVRDLMNLQMQPYVRRNYRRFVILKAMQDTHINYDRDGFEWRTVQDFDFKDDHGRAESNSTVEG